MPAKRLLAANTLALFAEGPVKQNHNTVHLVSVEAAFRFTWNIVSDIMQGLIVLNY